MSTTCPDDVNQVPLDLGSPTTELSLQGSLRLHLQTDLDGLHIDQLRDGLQLCKESEAGKSLLEKSWMMAGRNLHQFPNFIITTRQKDSQKHLNKGKRLRDQKPNLMQWM